MTNQEPDSLTGALARFAETTIERLIEILRSVDSTEDAAEQVRCRVADLEDLAGRLRLAVVAVLSHAIRRQHLPQGFTFDSELWNRLRDLGGDEACSAVTVEIERSQAALRKSDATTKNGFDICDL
jgi:hypothetical protein